MPDAPEDYGSPTPGPTYTTPAPTPAAKPAAAPTPDQTASGWATQFLTLLGKRLGKNLLNDNNKSFILSWMAAEGGNWHNTATFNPLNTTQPMPGSHGVVTGSGSSQQSNVQAYASWEDGLNATVNTLLQNQQGYGNIVAGLVKGDANSAAQAVVNSAWGTKTIDLSTGASYNPSGGGMAGGGVVSSVGANSPSTGNTQLSEGAFQAGLKDAGFAYGLLNSIPELKKIWDKAVRDQAWQSSTGQQNFINEVKSSKWFQTHTEAQRTAADMQFADPAQFNRLVSQQSADIRAQAIQLGIDLKPADIKNLATQAVVNGFDANETTAALAGKFQYNPNQPLTGQAGMDVNSIQKLASDYNVKFDPKQAQSMVQRLMTGQLNPDTLTEFFKQQALAQHPYLAQQLNAGLTVRDVATPYMQQMADTLEMDPNGINMSDPTIMKALQSVDPKGNMGLMPMYSFQQSLKQDPRWLQTTNAKNSLMDQAGSLLKNMGLVGAA